MHRFRVGLSSAFSLVSRLRQYLRFAWITLLSGLSDWLSLAAWLLGVPLSGSSRPFTESVRGSFPFRLQGDVPLLPLSRLQLTWER